MTKPRFATKAAICLGCIVALGAVALVAHHVLSGQDVSWTAEQDDSLDILATKAAGDDEVAQPEEGWASRDGYIQLQLLGSSIPEQKIESVEQDGDELTVTLKVQDGPMTIDILLTEWRLTGGDVESVKSVTIDYGKGDIRRAPQCP